MDCFEKSYPDVTLNEYDSPFCLWFMNITQRGLISGWQCNWLLDAVITILKEKKTISYYVIYNKVLYDGTMSSLIVAIDDILINTNNDTAFTVSEDFWRSFEIKFQEGSELK